MITIIVAVIFGITAFWLPLGIYLVWHYHRETAAWKRTALHTVNAKKAYEVDVDMAHRVAREATERRFGKEETK